MANPEDNLRQEAGSPDGRPRRAPPTIDVKAVELSLDGAGAAAAPRSTAGQAAAKRSLLSLSPAKLAVIGAICVGAAIAAGSVWIYFASNGGDGEQRDAVVQETAKPDDAAERIARLESDLKALSGRTLLDSALVSRVAALEAALGPLADRIAGLELGMRDNAAAARNAGVRADRAAELLDELRKSGAGQNTLQQDERAAIEGLAERVKALETLEATLDQRQEELDRTVKAAPIAAPDRVARSAMTAVALRDAVERDAAFGAEFAAARALGLDEKALALLEPFAATGVPSRIDLSRALSALVPELLRASTPASHDAGYLERLQASAIKMMNIRPARDESGDDPTAVIGRIELKATRQDIAGSAAELDKLPATAKELAAPWRAKARARQEAVEAARRIAAVSLARLGEPLLPEASPR